LEFDPLIIGIEREGKLELKEKKNEGSRGRNDLIFP
jgi:hypothetical protein